MRPSLVREASRYKHLGVHRLCNLARALCETLLIFLLANSQLQNSLANMRLEIA